MTLVVPNTFSVGQVIPSAGFNANFDAIEAWGNAIPVADLADGTDGQLIICSLTGVPTYRTLTGPVAISNAGVTTLAHSQADQVGTQALTANVYSGCVSLTLSVGTYLVRGKVIIDPTASSDTLTATLTQDTAEFDRAISVGDTNTLALGPEKITVASGTDDIWVEARTTGFGGTASYGRIAALRVA